MQLLTKQMMSVLYVQIVLLEVFYDRNNYVFPVRAKSFVGKCWLHKELCIGLFLMRVTLAQYGLMLGG